MFPLDFLKTIGQGLGGGVKKIGQGIIPKDKPELLRTPGFVPDGASAAGGVGGGILPSIAQPKAMLPLQTPNVAGSVNAAPRITESDAMFVRMPQSFSGPPQTVGPATRGNQVNELTRGVNMANLTPIPRTPPAMAAPTQGIVPTAPQMPGQMPNAREVAPPMDMDRRNVMLPALPGESGPKDYSRTEAARYDYHRKRMKQPGDKGYDGTGQYKRSGGDIFRNALMGFFQGAASDPRNPLAGGLGGALVGGVGSTVSPQGSAEYGFNTVERPRLDQQMADEDAERKRQNAMQNAELQQMLNAQKSRQLDADVELKKAQAEKARRMEMPKPQFHNVAPGAHVLNNEGKMIYQAPANPGTAAKAQGLINTREGLFDPVSRQWVEKFDKPINRTEALDEVYAEDGPLDQIVEDSLAGRQAALMERLTPQERTYIGKPPTDQDLGARLSPKQQAILSGVTDGATDAEVTQAYAAFERLKQAAANEMSQARNKWDQIQNAERSRIRRETEGTARQKATGKRAGSGPKLPQPQSGGSQGTTRPRSQFNSQKFPGLKFD